MSEGGGRERVGVFGGTFDPIHIGHLVAAVNVRHALALDRVLMVVANVPWQKSDRDITPAEDRLALVEAAVAQADGLEASRMEIDRGGDSYSADTLEELKRRDPDGELFLIVGADVGDELTTWVRWEVTARLATLVVVNRGGAPDPEIGPPWRVERVVIPALEVSSSDIRERCTDGRPLDFLTPYPAIDLIRDRGLYSVRR